MMAGWKDKKNPERDLKSTQLDTRQSPSESAAASKPSWKRPKGQTSKRAFWLQRSGKSVSKRPLWFVPLILAVVFIVVLALSLIRRPKTTEMLAFAGLDYSSPWQPNSWAEEDVDRFQSTFNEENALRCKTVVKKPTDFTAWKNTFKTSLQKATPGGPGGPRMFWKYQTLVIYVSAHGVVGIDGKPYLVFNTKDSEALTDKTGKCIEGAAPFETFLELIVESRTDSRILLLLDLGRQLPDARIPGVLLGIEGAQKNADFVEQAKPLVEKVSNSNLAVIFSADSQQISWPAPELSGTVFGTYVEYAFRGLADRNGGQNKQITVQELHKYVQEKVRDYVQTTRASVQEPQLVWGGGPGSGKLDFDVAYCKDLAQEPEISRNELRVAELDRLDKSWKRFNEWREGYLRTDPWKVAQVRQSLCYAEQLALGGKFYADKAATALVGATALMDQASSRSANLVGTSRFKGRPTDPQFNQPPPSSERPPEPGSTEKPDAAATGTAPAQPPAAQPQAPKAETPPTYADKARAWLLTPPGKDGAKADFVAENATIEEHLQFCWWWLNDSAHWTQKNIEDLDKIKPRQLAPQEVRLEDALVSQLIEEVRRVGSLWDFNASVNDQGPELLKWLDKVQLIYQQLELEPRVLLDEQAKQAIETLTQKLRLHRDCIYGRNQPALLDPAELDHVKSLINTLTENWRTLDQCADEIPVIANQLVPIAQSTADVNTELLEAYAKLAANIRSDNQKVASILTAQRNAYKNSVSTLIASQKGSTTELTPGALRDAYLHLHRLPLDGSNRADLFKKVRAHFGSQTTSRQQPGNVSKENLVAGYRVRLTAQNTTALSSIIKIDSRGDEARTAELWQKVIDNIIVSKGRLVSETELSGDRLLEQANIVRLLSNFAARREEEFDAARQQEAVAWQNYLLWRAEECMIDFCRTPTIRADEPFFATCAQAFIKAAEGLEHAPKRPVERTMERLSDRKEKSTQWASLLRRESISSPSSETKQRIPIDTNGFPPGKARIWQRDFRVNASNVSILPSAANGFPVGEVGDLSYDLSPGMNAKLFADYRGHTSEKPLQSRDPKTLFTVRQSLEPKRDARAVVSATSQPTEIVFVLDCSASFGGGRGSNFDKAKDALRTTLKTLKNRGNLKIAFVIFGHSAKWDKGLVVTQNPDVPQRRRSSDVSTDASILVRLSDANEETTKIILDELDSLTTFGNTPLYHAIIKSTSELSQRTNSDLVRRVVVITDGINEVYPREKGTLREIRENIRLADNSGPEQVAQAIAAHPNTQLDVLYLKGDEGGTPDPRLEEIVQKSGGRYFTYNRANQLSDGLGDAIEPYRHTVLHDGERREGDQQDYRTFGTESPLFLEGPRETFVVNVVKKQLTSVGTGSTYAPVDNCKFTAFAGDQIRLEYDRSKRQFTFPFDEPASNPLALSGSNIRAWRRSPRDSSSEVRFLIDRADSRSQVDQTIRPEWSIVEIGLNPKKPQARLWSPDVTWESQSELNRPVGSVAFDVHVRNMINDDGGESALPARLWVCTDPQGPKIVEEVELKAINFDTPHTIGNSLVRLKSELLSGNKTALDITVLPSKAPTAGQEVVPERWLARPPAADSVDHKFMEDGSVIFRYIYQDRKPSGVVQFYLAPSDRDTNWAHTEWVSTEL